MILNGQSRKSLMELQQELKDSFQELRMADCPAGNFKKVLPIPNTPAERPLALAYVNPPAKTESGIVAQYQLLCQEVKALRILKEKGFPVINVYGEVFEVEPQRYAIIMDYIPQAIFVDFKEENHALDAVKGFIGGVELPVHQEAYYMHKKRILEDLDKNLEDDSLQSFQAKASVLLKHLKLFRDKSIKENISIVDLQFLINPKGQFFIIDPLTLCVPSGQSYEDILSDEGEISMDFIKKLNETKNTLSEIEKLLEQVIRCETKDQLKTVLTLSFALDLDTRQKKKDKKLSLFQQIIHKKMKHAAENRFQLEAEFDFPKKDNKSYFEREVGSPEKNNTKDEKSYNTLRASFSPSSSLSAK